MNASTVCSVELMIIFHI